MSDCSTNAWKVAKPVVRSDGARYPSITAAANAIIERDGCGRLPTVITGISNCCKGKDNRKSAYGFGWRFE